MKQQGRSAIAVIVSSCLLVFLLTSDALAMQQPTQPPASKAGRQGGRVAERTVRHCREVGYRKYSVPIERASVGFGDVAEATAVGPMEVLVNGKAAGETSLIIWQRGGGKLFFDILVQPSRFGNNNKADILRRQITRELPGQKIDVGVENDLIFLRGTARTLPAPIARWPLPRR